MLRRIVFAVVLAAVCAAGGFAYGRTGPTRSADDEVVDEVRYTGRVFDVGVIGEDLEYGSAPGVDGSPEALLLDLYEPAGDTADARPAIVFVHGGGYGSGDKQTGPAFEMARDFARRGFVTASIDHRLLAPLGCQGGSQPENECLHAAGEAIHDAQAAVRWLRAGAAEHRIDPDRIAIVGESSGALTAAGVGVWSDQPGASGTPEQPSTVAAWVSISGGLPNGLFIDAGDAPGLLFASREDRIVPYDWSVDAERAMKRFGVPVRLVTYDGSGHVPWGEHGPEMTNTIVAFLDRQLDLGIDDDQVTSDR